MFGRVTHASKARAAAQESSTSFDPQSSTAIHRADPLIANEKNEKEEAPPNVPPSLCHKVDDTGSRVHDANAPANASAAAVAAPVANNR